MGYWYDYSGKPSGTLKVEEGGYKKLDAVTEAPNQNGLEGHMIYFNAHINWKNDGAEGATIRVKYIRDDGDATGYQSFAVLPDGLIGDDFLVTHIHWEIGEKGMGGRWSVRIDGDVKSMVLDTRYAKIYSIDK